MDTLPEVLALERVSIDCYVETKDELRCQAEDDLIIPAARVSSSEPRLLLEFIDKPRRRYAIVDTLDIERNPGAFDQAIDFLHLL